MAGLFKEAVQKVADHPVRHALQNAIAHLPFADRLQMANATTGAMNQPEVMAEWAKRIVKTTKDNDADIQGANIVEIGAGHSLGVAAMLLARGAASVTAIDIKAYADPQDIDQFLPIVKQSQENGLLPAHKHINLSRIQQQLNYSIVEADGPWALKTNSVDLVYSYFSGEHWRSVDHVLSEAYRVLKPGGLCIHAIDLRDHYHFHDNWLQFLYYEPWLWETMASQRGGWSNRLVAPLWRKHFRKRFDILSFQETRSKLPSDFDPDKLATSFKRYSLNTLSVSHLWVVARKPPLLKKTSSRRVINRVKALV